MPLFFIQTVLPLINMIITKNMLDDCLHCLAGMANYNYKDSKVNREQLMISHEVLRTFLYSNHHSRKYYELIPYKGD